MCTYSGMSRYEAQRKKRKFVPIEEYEKNPYLQAKHPVGYKTRPYNFVGWHFDVINGRININTHEPIRFED